MGGVVVQITGFLASIDLFAVDTRKDETHVKVGQFIGMIVTDVVVEFDHQGELDLAHLASPLLRTLVLTLDMSLERIGILEALSAKGTNIVSLGNMHSFHMHTEMSLRKETTVTLVTLEGSLLAFML